MALLITPIIGKKDLRGRVLVARAPEGSIVESLRRVQEGSRVVGLRLRPEISAPDWRNGCSSQVRNEIAGRIEQLEADKELSFGTLRKFDPIENRTVTVETITLGPDEVVTTNAQAATVLLDHAVNGYLLEEVDLGQQRPQRVNRGEKLSYDAKLVERGAEALSEHKAKQAVQDELDRLKAALAAQGIDAGALVEAAPKIAGPASPRGRGRQPTTTTPITPPAPAASGTDDTNDTP